MNKQKRLLLIVLLSIGFVIYMSYKIMTSISYNVKDYLLERVNKENMLLLKSSFSYLKQEDVSLDNLISVVKNTKEEIVEVNFDIKECTLILSHISGYINDSLTEYNTLGYRLDIPTGIVSNNFLLQNLGPKIPIKVEIGDVALGNVTTTVKEFGINNALIKINLRLTLNTSILYPFEALTKSTTYDTLIASKIITGHVPDFYNGAINSKSDTITLPLNE